MLYVHVSNKQNLGDSNLEKKYIQQNTIASGGPMTVLRYPFWSFITSDKLEY